MVVCETRFVFRAAGARRARLTLKSACRDAARGIVYRMAAASGDDVSDLMHEKRQQVHRVADAMERRLLRRWQRQQGKWEEAARLGLRP